MKRQLRLRPAAIMILGRRASQELRSLAANFFVLGTERAVVTDAAARLVAVFSYTEDERAEW